MKKRVELKYANWKFVEEKWEAVKDSPYARQIFDDTGEWIYRCSLCFENKKFRYCEKEGDMHRHLTVLEHQEKAFRCIHPRCTNAYTRKDSLTRHVNNVHPKLRKARRKTKWEVLDASSFNLTTSS